MKRRTAAAFAVLVSMAARSNAETASVNRWGGNTARAEETYAGGRLVREDEYDAEGNLMRRVETYPVSFLAEEPVALAEFYWEAGELIRTVRFFTRAFIAASGGCFKETIIIEDGAAARCLRHYLDGRTEDGPSPEWGRTQHGSLRAPR
jgi:hypothetical protein